MLESPKARGRLSSGLRKGEKSLSKGCPFPPKLPNLSRHQPEQYGPPGDECDTAAALYSVTSKVQRSRRPEPSPWHDNELWVLLRAPFPQLAETRFPQQPRPCWASPGLFSTMLCAPWVPLPSAQRGAEAAPQVLSGLGFLEWLGDHKALGKAGRSRGRCA